ncbi:hypothetical protein A4G19_15860 [Pasteurellaceae bacterium Macca]|nr:hypothetical protein [Pasteurellaceae bacterium Macca]MCK3656256.1 hypothetical protein [Pasteurellaceae bacterium Macca]MCK3656509.1 hypothetical protein [Pasteurellaceae bacterium Macca]MCK3657131.1 hypothetical protein [Pasteurellaceae bacterium Macca]
MSEINENGLQIDRLDEVVERISQGFRQIYGQNIDLSPDSPDGQLVGLLAQMVMDQNELLENAYRQIDPDLASGAWLEQRVAYAGLVRGKAKYSYLPAVVLTGEPLATIPAGVIISDTTKTRWVLQNSVTLNAQGSAKADFRSEELGAFNVPVHTAMTIETITFGLHSVTTQTESQIGAEEESDIELRQRFFLSRSRNATNSVSSLEGKLLALPDVRQVSILENNLAETDKNQLPPHSINVIVLGGDEQQIAQVIYHNKGGGTGMKGETEIRIRHNEKERLIRFDKAKQVDIHLSTVVVRDKDFTEIDHEGVKQAISALPFKIGENVNLSRLYTPINTVGGFWVQSLKIGRNSHSLVESNIALSPREIARFLPENIHIEVR